VQKYGEASGLRAHYQYNECYSESV